MALDFSLFADDMVLEILGHLPALDVVRYRRVCKRIFQASNERSVWTNVLSRTHCPLPYAGLESLSPRELEKLLVRMEIMDAKWLRARPTTPREYRISRKQLIYNSLHGLMSIYVVLSRQEVNATIFTWYRRDDLQNPVMEYPITSPLLDTFCEIEVGANVLHIASIERSDPSETPPTSDAVHHLKITKFGVSTDGDVIQISEQDVPLQGRTIDGAEDGLSIQNGYVIFFRCGINDTCFELVHIDTGRAITCPLTSISTDGGQILGHFGEYVVATSHLIQLEGFELAFYELPSKKELENPNVPIKVLRKTHTGTLPSQLNALHFFPRSPNSIVAVGLVDNRHEIQASNLHIHFLTLDLEQHSSVCRVQTTSTYEIVGSLRSFHLVPCSSSSRSALGLLTVEAPLPTHTPSGRRIARSSKAPRVYHLAVRVDFGLEGRIAPSITLGEVDLTVNNPGRWTKVRAFDPYAGQILLEEYEDSGGRPGNELVVVDYATP